MVTEAFKAYADEAIVHTYNRFPVVFHHGDGVYLYDTEGKKYLDFAAGIAVNAFGYNVDAYKEALKDQNISVLRVIHGYHSDILMKMVRKEFRTHPRVDHIELSMNKGLTDLVIKKGFL